MDELLSMPDDFGIGVAMKSMYNKDFNYEELVKQKQQTTILAALATSKLDLFVASADSKIYATIRQIAREIQADEDKEGGQPKGKRQKEGGEF